MNYMGYMGGYALATQPKVIVDKSGVVACLGLVFFEIPHKNM